MDPFTIGFGALGVLSGLFAGDDPPEWKNVEFEKNLGLNTGLDFYDYDPDRKAYAGYMGALGAGERSLQGLKQAKTDFLNQRRRMASEMVPGMASFRATGASAGLTGGTSGVLAGLNFNQAQRAGQEWADANFNPQAYDLAAAQIPMQAYQISSPYMQMELARGQFAVANRAQADMLNKQYYADQWNSQLQFNTMGKYGQQNAAWQNRQAKWNSIAGAGMNVMGYGLTAPNSGIFDGLFKKQTPTKEQQAIFDQIGSEWEQGNMPRIGW